MNQSINTDSKKSKEPQQKYRLGTVSIKILGEYKFAWVQQTNIFCFQIWLPCGWMYLYTIRIIVRSGKPDLNDYHLHTKLHQFRKPLLLLFVLHFCCNL